MSCKILSWNEQIFVQLLDSNKNLFILTIIGRKEKLLKELNRDAAKNDFTFDELTSLLLAHGWKLTRSAGSHHIFISPTGQVVNVKKKPGKMKSAYVLDVRNALNNN